MWTRRRVLTVLCWHPDLRLLASRTVRKKFLWLPSHPGDGICYSSPMVTQPTSSNNCFRLELSVTVKNNR